jgi:hypothetical protein
VAKVDGKLVTEGEVSFAVYRPDAGAKQAGGDE